MIPLKDADLEKSTWGDACQRLIRALCVETHEAWPESSRYLNMDLLLEHKKALLEKCGSSSQTVAERHENLFAQADAHNATAAPFAREETSLLKICYGNGSGTFARKKTGSFAGGIFVFIPKKMGYPRENARV
jgi:hypothetical protein